MNLGFSDEDEAFRQEVRAFYEEVLPPDWFGAYDSREDENTFIQGIRKRLAEKQWLTMSWPREYGGLDAPISRQLIFAEESAYYRFNARDTGVGYLGPAIIYHGTEEQKQRFLPRIANADIEFHQGFSEPDNGSDLAGLRTRADRDGDFYVINGQKIWGGHLRSAEYSFLLARTEQDVPKHRGISLLIIPADTPGLRYEEFGNLAGGIQNVAYYDNCRVPVNECLIGEENRGWYIGQTVLNHERVVVEYAASGQRYLEEMVDFWKGGGRNAYSRGENGVMRRKLAQFAIEIEVCHLLQYRVGYLQSIGANPSYEASQMKIFGSEMTQRNAHMGSSLWGQYSQFNRKDAKYGKIGGRAEQSVREQPRFTLIGGTSEIQRNVIAARGLGLPRD